ncbi:esterase family protein [bacterium]|nr:esterase family protein [bacterium]
MKIESHKWWSPAIRKEMQLKVYGHWGIPFLVFPCAGGNYTEFEGFGMIKLLSKFIDDGKIKVFTIGSLDNETWLNKSGNPYERGNRHNDYDRYIVDEVVPFIHNNCNGKQRIMLTGCSLGAYHCVNFFLRHPDVFRGTIALSGVYRLNHFVGDYMDDSIFYNSPIHYVPGLKDSYQLDWIKKGQLIICSGQGPWEDVGLADLQELRKSLSVKKIPHWIDIWGHEVNHDWPWWKKQLPYFMNFVLK